MPTDYALKMKYCACGCLRKTTRVITQFYDKYVKSTGLSSPQCALLANISRQENISVNELAAKLLMDQTTATRNIAILKKNGLISISKAEHDARKKAISITQKGIEKLKEVIPLWEQAQQKVQSQLGAEDFEKLNSILNKIQAITK